MLICTFEDVDLLLVLVLVLVKIYQFAFNYISEGSVTHIDGVRPGFLRIQLVGH